VEWLKRKRAPGVEYAFAATATAADRCTRLIAVGLVQEKVI
jgi:hypothetical protein